MSANGARHGRSKLASAIRQEIAKPANRRQLARLPAFKPVKELPEHLRLLLARLQQEEELAGR
jgi:hypothetical protein